MASPMHDVLIGWPPAMELAMGEWVARAAAAAATKPSRKAANNEAQ